MNQYAVHLPALWLPLLKSLRAGKAAFGGGRGIELGTLVVGLGKVQFRDSARAAPNFALRIPAHFHVVEACDPSVYHGIA